MSTNTLWFLVDSKTGGLVTLMPHIQTPLEARLPDLGGHVEPYVFTHEKLAWAALENEDAWAGKRTVRG